MENAGRSNGMYFDNDGHLLTCADEKNEIWSISPEGEVSVLVASFKERRLNGPNDLWVHPDGGIYFTDPYYQREYWSHNEIGRASCRERVEIAEVDETLKKTEK